MTTQYISSTNLETAFKSLPAMIQATTNEDRTAAISAIIEQTNGYIDFFIKQVNPLGITGTVPDYLVKLGVDLAVYAVYKRLDTSKIPGKAEKDKEKAEEILGKIADGNLKITPTATASATASAIGVSSDFERVF